MHTARFYVIYVKYTHKYTFRICSDACIYTEVCKYACIYIYKAERQIHDLNIHLYVKYIKCMHAYIYTILSQ